jgi:hypothetical protein
LQRFILRGNLLLVWSQFIVNEAIKVIDDMWPWYHTHGAKVDPAFVKRLLDRICDPSGCVPEMPDGWPPASIDRDDDQFLWAAWQGKAEYIISYDKSHMLNLGSFQGIPIGTAKQFFDWVTVAHPMDTPEIEPDNY